MIKLISKSVLNVYIILDASFKNRTFTFQEALKELELKKLDKNSLSLALSKLRRSEWLTIHLSTEDARKREYKLKPIPEIFKEYSKQHK